MISLNTLLKNLSQHCDIEVINKQNIDLSHHLVGLNTLTQAVENELSFLDNKAYIKELYNTKACGVFIHPDYTDKLGDDVVALSCSEPYVALAYASQYFSKPLILDEGKAATIADNAIIQENVHLGRNVVIGDNTTIMSGAYIADNVSIGNNVIIYPNVCIYHSCSIGDRTIIHAGTVIGSDGFGFAISKNNGYVKIYQNGNTIIGNDVEIGANCTIDRAVFASTIIEDESHLDNLVHIAHNCIVGKRSILTGQVGLAGSTILGEQVIMGGQSASSGHLEVPAFTTIAARGGVTKTIKEKGHYAGFPLMPHRAWLKLQGKLQKLLK